MSLLVRSVGPVELIIPSAQSVLQPFVRPGKPTPRLGPGFTVLDQISVAGAPAGIAAAPGNTFYLGTGNTVYWYSDAGTVLGSISGSSTTQMIDLSYRADADSEQVPEPATGLLILFSAVGVAIHRRAKPAARSQQARI